MTPLDAIGRAARFATDDGGEVWRLPRDDERVARRLVALGAENAGGFTALREIGESVEIDRLASRDRLDGVAKGDRWAWRDALALVRDVARALEACEKAGLFPGPLAQADIVRGAPSWLTMDALVSAMLGGAESGPRSSHRASPLWTPPEQADGAPWDSAANRYVLGLVAYRLLAGRHPFAGEGLRHALAELAKSAPPPFEDEIARALRPGVQSFVLAMIDPSKKRRPPTARAIVERCDVLLGEKIEQEDGKAGRGRLGNQPRTLPVFPSSCPLPLALPLPSPPRSRRLAWLLLPIVAGVVAAVSAVAAVPAAPPAPARPTIGAAHLDGTRPEDCASCHAREVAEWERSVMAHATKSPLFGALESVVEEEVGRTATCPNGAGVLRRAAGDICKDDASGLTTTGTGGEHWCVSCHAPGENLDGTSAGAARRGQNQGPSMPAWSALGAARGREPVRDLLSAQAMDGISCAGCHETRGPVAIHARARQGAYEGNPTWTSFVTGAVFTSRPEDARGVAGIANSGYALDSTVFLSRSPSGARVHAQPPEDTQAYLRSSAFCGACHDVRLFGTDAVGVGRGEHFKRLRDAYSEWRAWADGEARAGRSAATCKDCHMSLYPGVCVDGAGGGGAGGCPKGTHFESRAPGTYLDAAVAPTSAPSRSSTHYFTSVDVPLTETFPDGWIDDLTLDASGLPLGLAPRRDMLLRSAFRFEVSRPRRDGARLEIPVVVENVGGGHRVPAGFSQEREIWVEMTVSDADGREVYSVGKIAAPDADLRDKIFLRITTTPDGATQDFRGRPLGVFGADVADGPDVPQWDPPPGTSTSYRGKGLLNLQNGFLRCVRCIGFIDGDGKCQALGDQAATRAARFADGAYDLDTGECRSNLTNGHELFETYFPVGALDADRGVAKAPDAIVGSRSAPPGVPLTFTYVLDAGAHRPPFRVEARLRFRSFPPFLVRAFAAYEAEQSARGARPSGPQVTTKMLARIAPVDLATASARIE